jgi:hypothetical protein
VEDAQGRFEEGGAYGLRQSSIQTVSPPARFIQRGVAQEMAILDAIRKLGLDPLALPKPKAGKRGVKVDIREDLLKTRKDVFGKRYSLGLYQSPPQIEQSGVESK